MKNLSNFLWYMAARRIFSPIGGRLSAYSPCFMPVNCSLLPPFPVDFPLAVVFAEECRLFVERAILSAVNRGGTLGISTFFFSAGYPLQGASTLLFVKKRFSPGWFDLAFRKKEGFTRVVRPCFS